VTTPARCIQAAILALLVGTPDWVYAKGVPSIRYQDHRPSDGSVVGIATVPVPWNDTYSGFLTLRATPEDDSGTIQKMEFYIGSDAAPARADATPRPSSGTFIRSSGVANREPGAHTVAAKAYDPSGNAASSTPVSFSVSGGVAQACSGQGTCTVRTYRSSVDGVEIKYLEHLPAGFDSAKAYPLAIYLHGGGGTMQAISGDLHTAADRYQYIVVSIDGRPLSFQPQTFCPRGDCPSPFYFDSPMTGPGERDVLDLVADVKSRHRVNERRIYLVGFSMGGWGTWGVGMRNPGVFAAIAPIAGPTCGFHARLRDFATALGGDPVTTTDMTVRTRWLMISARFLLENAMHTPMHGFYGDLDSSVPNNPSRGYAHGHHVIDTPGWKDEWGSAITLKELAEQYPGHYIGEGTWVPNMGHMRELADPDTLYQFFDKHTLDPNPRQIAFKTYDDVHTTAYWGRIDIARPWSTAYGLFRAARNPEQNSFTVSADGESTITLDLRRMEIGLGRPILFQAGPLNNYGGSIALKLRADWSGRELVLKRDGSALRLGADYSVSGELLTMNSFSLATRRQFELAASGGTLRNVSSASYRVALAPESIASAFGARLATATLAASSTPLPTSLSGTSVKVRDSAGTERLAPLFSVSAAQVNYQIPPGTATGAATVTITSGDGAVSTEPVWLSPVAPGIFAANGDGQGVAAAQILRLIGGSQTVEAVAEFNQAQRRFLPLPIDLGAEPDQVFLILYGTGIRNHTGLARVTAKIGGADAEVLFAGAQGGFAGLDQVNVRLPRSLKGRGEQDVVLTVDGQASNAVRLSFQ